MFENDVVEWDAARTLAAVDRACTAEREAGAERLILAVHFADLYPSPCMIPGDRSVPGGDKALVFGGPGCPGVSQFAVAEYAVVRGVSPETAAKDIGQALALRHRHPLIWTAVMNRTATAWRARLIATECAALSVEAAAIVDRRVHELVDSISPRRLTNIVKAAIWEADPEAAQAEAERKARERGVWIGRSDDHGTTTMFVKAPTGAVIRLYATINRLADALAALGDTDPLQQRRAKAVDILSDPAFADKLLQVGQYLAAHPDAGITEQDTSTSTASSAGSGSGTDTADTNSPDPTDTTTGTANSPDTETTTGSANCGAAPATEAAAGPSTNTATSTADTRDIRTNTGADGAPADIATGDKHRANNSAEAGTTTDATDLEVTFDGELASDLFLADEPTADSEADRDTPHPSHAHHPLDPLSTTGANHTDTDQTIGDIVHGMDAAARHDLATKLAAIKQAADTDRSNNLGPTRTRPARTKLYIHLTDETLLAGGGTTRIENYGPAFTTKLAELLGHDHIVIQPVIDLNQHLNVNAYEIPLRIRERVKLMYPVDQFPYSSSETTNSTDLDHIKPYEPDGPPGQTSTTNLQPLGRPGHRVKTHAPGWTVRRIDDHTIEWTTQHGYTVHVDHTGTHPVRGPDPAADNGS